jgi:hypothetical protein
MLPYDAVTNALRFQAYSLPQLRGTGFGEAVSVKPQHRMSSIMSKLPVKGVLCYIISFFSSLLSHSSQNFLNPEGHDEFEEHQTTSRPFERKVTDFHSRRSEESEHSGLLGQVQGFRLTQHWFEYFI